MGSSRTSQAASSPPVTRSKSPSYYDPDAEFERLAKRTVPNPVLAAMEAIAAGTATVREAQLFEGQFDERGKLLREGKLLKHRSADRPYRTTTVTGHGAFMEAVKNAEGAHRGLPTKAAEAREAKATLAQRLREANAAAEADPKREAVVLDDTVLFDGSPTSFDANQYTEFTPTYGGPYFKQLYLYDYQIMHSRAYEAWNHNPLAKRIINIFAQYAFGRRFKVTSDDEAKLQTWNEFADRISLMRKMPFWIRERLIYGELFIHKDTWQSVDPSTIWDIITDPDDIENVYYYHQQYSTAYFQFTGKQVPGVKGSAKTKPIEYIIRQIPYDRIIHTKGDCVSNEKRGRSFLFPVLGWLKRVKDLYNAQVIQAQLAASFIWDDLIKGSQADIDAHVARYNSMPLPGSVFAHNESVTRTPMSAMSGGSGRTAGNDVGAEILSFIATAVGVPKDFFNVVGQSGGSRATALVGAEPFTKAIEDLQAEFEELLHQIAKAAFEEAGQTYERGDLEFVFPSVTKDTTTERLQNIALLEELGYVSKETAATMAAAEMDITTFDFEQEQKTRDGELEKAVDQAAMSMPATPGSRFGGKPGPENPLDKSPIHGSGAGQLKDNLNRI